MDWSPQRNAVLCARHDASTASGKFHFLTHCFKPTVLDTQLKPYQAPANSINAVIMGRKTWDSIPPKFRPLKNRLNIIISRSHAPPPPGTEVTPSEPVRVSSLEQAIEFVKTHPLISRVFVMGGGQIYNAALKMDAAKRVLLTSIDKEYECDTFFGLDVHGGEARELGWRKRRVEEWREWTGEGGESHMEESGVGYEWQLWERE